MKSVNWLAFLQILTSLSLNFVWWKSFIVGKGGVFFKNSFCAAIFGFFFLVFLSYIFFNYLVFFSEKYESRVKNMNLVSSE